LQDGYDPMTAAGQDTASQSATATKRFRALALFVVPLVVGGVGLGLWLSGGRYIATENAFVKADIVQVASEVAGRIEALTVRDHARIEAGDVLVRLESAPYRLALAKADAELDSARAAVEQAKAALKEATAEVREAASRLEFLATQAERQKGLAGRGVAPTTRLEQADSDARLAGHRVALLREKQERAMAALGGDATRPTDAYAIVREKIALRDRAALDLENTTVRAPHAGIVVNLRLQPGEQVKPQTPLFAIVSDRRPWVEANFKETDLTHVSVGQTATVSLDIYPGVTWDAVVESISPATGAEFAILPPQNASGNWVKVVQRLPVKLRLIERAAEPALRAGVAAAVTIDTRRQRSLGSLFGGGTADATPNK
jgi:membrane fusion protein (multidrug efflux system)